MDPSKPLQDAQHERFACELAKGASQDEAYVLAGFSRNRGNASRLNANENVSQRVAWLKEQAATDTVLSIREKREFLARVVRVKGAAIDEEKDGDLINGLKFDKYGNRILEIPCKLGAMRLDNDLAGEGSEAKGAGAIAALLGRLRG